MPTLNINVNTRTERAKKDLRSLDREILKLSDSEKILNKSLAKSGNVGGAAFRKISSAAVKQAKAVNSAAGQFRQLRSQLQATGAAPQVIGRLTQEFVTFRKVMEGGTVSSLKFQRTQDKFSNTLRTTARQFRLLTGEVKDSTNATAKLNALNKANQAALAKQAHALSNAKIQYKQLLAQMHRLGASKSVIRSTTQAFVTFSKGMKTATLSSRDLQRAQDKLKTSFAGTRRQLVRSVVATNKVGKAANKGRKSITGLGHSLENLGSTAVLVAGPLSGIGSRLIAFGAIAKRGSLLAAGLFTALAAVGVFITKSIKAFDRLNLSLAKTKAILKATGKEAHITAEFVEEAASKIARTTLANLEDTRPIASALLSFRGIDSGNLESILGLAQDISATGFTDFANAAKLLGRVLEDPIANLDALRRVFVQLTPLQKDQITNLQNMGKGAEAAGIIIDVLTEKFGGVGASQNIGLSGAMDRLGQSWTHLLENFGGGGAYTLAVESIEGLAAALGKLVEIKKIFKSNFKSAGELMDSLRGESPTAVIVPFPKEEEPAKVTAPAPSRFEKALLDANINIEESFRSLDAERGKLQDGFSLISSEILELAHKFKVSDEVVNALAGDFSGLNAEGRKMMLMTKQTNNAFLELGRRKEAAAIINDTRTALMKYNEELKRVTFLYENGYIATSHFIAKTEQLLATLGESPSEAAMSGFVDALIDANTGIKNSLMDLDAERERVQRGFSLMSPEMLKITQKYEEFDDIVKILAGDFSKLDSRGRKIANMFNETNDALLDLGRRKEAEAIFNSTRTALVRYNDELKRLIFLQDNGYISTSNLITKQKELRATLENSTPELKALTSASEKFGDSLADLMVKGEGFAAGLKSIFKSLVDDILKQFLKLSVINPILNGIFGASSNRPTLGSQGGGQLGLGGAGGLLGGIMGGGKTKGGNDTSKEVIDKNAEIFNETGAKAAKDYGKALDKTNDKMGQAGAKGAMDFGATLSGMASGAASAVGGTIGSFFGHKFADLLGFQHGGSFKVGGTGGKDSQLVAFKASPREKVSVETPNQQGKQGSGNVTYIDARGVDPGQMDRLIQIVRDLDESVEIRAINSTADARDRNPSLFGRTL